MSVIDATETMAEQGTIASGYSLGIVGLFLRTERQLLRGASLDDVMCKKREYPTPVDRSERGMSETMPQHGLVKLITLLASFTIT